MRWIWDSEKNRANKLKHGIGFETAALVFGDPLAITRDDPHLDGDRLRTVGAIGFVTVFVVHAIPELDIGSGAEIGQIISARKATTHERTAYEEGGF